MKKKYLALLALVVVFACAAIAGSSSTNALGGSSVSTLDHVKPNVACGPICNGGGTPPYPCNQFYANTYVWWPYQPYKWQCEIPGGYQWQWVFVG